MFGISKQAYYKYDESKALLKATQEVFVLEYVRSVRKKDPGMGGNKIWHMYRRYFNGYHPVGRDRFADIIDKYNLKVRLKVRKPRTTDSTHGLPTYPNIVKDLIPTRANQLWVSDITYITIWVDEYHYMFCYLSLILDAFTEEIVGWSVGPTLETRYPIEALQMALGRIKVDAIVDLIHHSDRGCQYVSSEYVKLLKDNHIRISMTETGDPKDNPQAERINNTIKNELLKDKLFAGIEEVKDAITHAVDFYNNERPHMSLGMKTPAEMVESTGERDMLWKSWRMEAIKTKNELDIPENCLPLLASQGSPSGLRPSVNP